MEELWVPVAACGFFICVLGTAHLLGYRLTQCDCTDLDELCEECIEYEFNTSENPLLSKADILHFKNN